MKFPSNIFSVFSLRTALRVNCHCSYATQNSYIKIIEEKDRKFARLLMNRNPVNALNTEMMQQLMDSVKSLEESQFRGVILQSSLPTIFCSGLDLDQLYKTSEQNLLNYLKSFQKLWETFYMSSLITIAAINGHAPAGGCILALSCDRRIMVKSQGRIGISAVMMGFSPPKWALHALANVVGVRKAEDAVMTGKLFTPAEAFSEGLVDRLVDHDQLLPKAEEEMMYRLKVPETALKSAKKYFRQPTIESFKSYENQDMKRFVDVILSDEVQTLIGNHIEKLRKKSK